MALNRSFTLNTGAKIPAVGFGTWQAAPKEVETAVEIALRSGYRHIDCAAIYRNETEVGAGIRKSGVSREDIFITTKLWNTKQHSYEEAEAGLDKSLRDLGLQYVDLYLIHWPVEFASGDKWFPLDNNGVFQAKHSNIPQVWSFMEKLLETGKTKAIGVSNFNVRRLKELLATCKVKPAVNQIEIHPYLQQSDLMAFCKSQDILLEAYSPLGNNQTGEPKTVDDVEVHAVAKSLDMDPGQVLVSWGVQRGWVVLPKSVTEKRIKGNFQDQVLPEEAMKKLDALERHKRFNFPARWGIDIFDEKDEAELKKIAAESGEENKTKFNV
ncbi:hypothetical protein H2198_003626 [Neophaeococcomyces mojaviensis]|uniref:Uncharacterized protein n=1 Tax=Neophaeococcomyces mojaviensis TaxID=3383035 RepID=A0ACC3AAY7_9EURO|nr:hypothetical protein H2198_003626 [Knufia sp. JES_112]